MPRISKLCALLCAAAYIGVTSGHGMLFDPAPRMGMRDVFNPNADEDVARTAVMGPGVPGFQGMKLTPFQNAVATANALPTEGGCGGLLNGDRGGEPIISSYHSGESMLVQWKLTIPHPPDADEPGVRIALHYHDGDSFANNILASGVSAGNTEDNVFGRTVMLPAGKECKHCILQWMWAAQDDGGFYLSCADITIDDGVIDYVATFPNLVGAGAPHGTVRFQWNPDVDDYETTIHVAIANLATDRDITWAIHSGALPEEMLPSVENCQNNLGDVLGGSLGATPPSMGDLTARNGPLGKSFDKTFRYSFMNKNLEMFGLNGIVGHSVVIYNTQGEMQTCAVITGEASHPAVFIFAIVGTIVGLLCCLGLCAFKFGVPCRRKRGAQMDESMQPQMPNDNYP